MRTAGAAAALDARADRAVIPADGGDLSFVTVRVVDRNGLLAPRARHRIRFTVDGPGEIVATDNGDPTSFVPFQSHEREAFNGLALVIVRARKGATGQITVTASGDGLTQGVAVIRVVRPPIPIPRRAARSDFLREIMSCPGGHEFFVGLGERIVLDQACKMFELVRAEQDPQVRRRRLEIVNRGGIGIGQVARQLVDSPLHLLRIACLSRFAVCPFQCRSSIRG